MKKIIFILFLSFSSLFAIVPIMVVVIEDQSAEKPIKIVSAPNDTSTSVKIQREDNETVLKEKLEKSEEKIKNNNYFFYGFMIAIGFVLYYMIF